MAAVHSLDGLMKWLRRDPWREAFGEVLERHLGPACAKAEIGIDDLAEVIGEDGAMTLWGCAFEDFLTHELDGGSNITDDYLKRRGWKESASSKAYMAVLRASVMSLYEVSDVVPGESFLARDLVRGGEPVRVSERSATQSLKPWDRIGARVLRVGPKIVIGGGVLPFDHAGADNLLGALRRVTKRAPKETRKLVRALGSDVDNSTIAEAFSETAMLAAAAPMFSTVWLADLLGRVRNPKMPQLRNSDGDELLFSTLHYRVKPGASAEVVRQALDTWPALSRETDMFWNWIEPAKSRRPARSAPASAGGQVFSTTLSDGSIVLGTVELKDRELVLAVNSKSRAIRGRALLEPVLRGLVGEPLVEMQTVDQLIASRPSSGPKSSPSGLSAEEERAIIHQSLDRHYAETLDEPVAMLGDVTPRQAAQTAKGRKKLASWIKLLENRSAKQGPGEPMSNYDFAWLWRELGIEDLRH